MEANLAKMSLAGASQPKRAISLRIVLACLLVVIVALLGAKVVPTDSKERAGSATDPRLESSSSQREAAPSLAPATAVAAAAATVPASESKPSTSDQTQGGQTGVPPTSVAKVTNSKTEPQQQQQQAKKCDYDKGQWDECEPNGVQQKVMRLRQGGPECKATKTIRRDCKAKGEVGCKYSRGEWSSECQNGLRVRTDTLVGPVDAPNESGALAGASTQDSKCKPQRRVTKDCRRTCHYVKSAWSECSNGFRTRALTLVEQPTVRQTANGEGPATRGTTTTTTRASATNQKGALLAVPTVDNQICVRQRVIRRKCTAAESKATAKSLQLQQQQQQQQREIGATTGGATLAQRRRLKQLQVKQQQRQQEQQQSLATSAPSLPPSQPPPLKPAANKARATTATTTTTTTTAAASTTATTPPPVTSRSGTAADSTARSERR